MKAVQKQRGFPKVLRGISWQIFEKAWDKVREKGTAIYGSGAKMHKILQLRGTGLRIEWIESNLYHDYVGVDYVETSVWIYEGRKLLFHVCYSSFYKTLEKYIPGDWEAKILKSRG